MFNEFVDICEVCGFVNIMNNIIALCAILMFIQVEILVKYITSLKSIDNFGETILMFKFKTVERCRRSVDTLENDFQCVTRTGLGLFSM